MNLKVRRLICGYTQTQMAKFCRVSLNTYRLWEEGVTTPRDYNLKRVSALLDLEGVPSYEKELEEVLNGTTSGTEPQMGNVGQKAN